MSRLLSILLVAALATLCSCSLFKAVEDEHVVATSGEPPLEIVPSVPVKKKVLLLNVLNRTGYSGDLGEFTQIEIEKLLGEARDIKIVRENDMDESSSFTVDDIHYNYRSIFEKAKAAGISAVVGGIIENLEVASTTDDSGLFRVENFNTKAALKLEAFDPQSGHELFKRTATGIYAGDSVRWFANRGPASTDSSVGKEAVGIALGKMEDGFIHQIRKLNWVGSIAKVDVERYYITGGMDTGFTKGQLLKVFGPSYLVRDSGNNSLGVAPGRFKGILRIVDFVGDDAAVALLHSGAGFREQDRVEVFTP